MSRKLEITVPEKQDAFSRILRFYTKADITLTANEEGILHRWLHCDVLLRQGIKMQDEIVDELVDMFKVSKFTALNDINQTQRLFERARQANKKYLGHIHLERINQDIQKVRGRLFKKYKNDKDEEVETVPDDKEMQALSKLYDSYTRALTALPDDQLADKQPPPMFVFNMAPGQQLDAPMSTEDAMKAADEILMRENGEGVFEMEKDS